MCAACGFTHGFIFGCLLLLGVSCVHAQTSDLWCESFGAGLDQTRGWFYTLMVLSTALFDKPAFKNLVCNGLVLASDGKKMSKRLKNYPVRFSSCSLTVVAFNRLTTKNEQEQHYEASMLLCSQAMDAAAAPLSQAVPTLANKLQTAALMDLLRDGFTAPHLLISLPDIAMHLTTSQRQCTG